MPSSEQWTSLLKISPVLKAAAMRLQLQVFPSNHPRPWFEVVRFGEANFGFESSSEPSCRVVVVWNGRGSGCASGSGRRSGSGTRSRSRSGSGRK